MYLLQLISLFIYVVVMFNATRNFKQTVLIWAPLSMLFNPQVCVWYRSPITSLTVAVDISLTLYYFFFVRQNPQKHELREGTFFFNTAINLMLISYILTTILSEIPFSVSFNWITKMFLDQYGLVILFYRCINDKNDVRLFLKSTILTALVAVSDGLIEFILHTNPIADFIYYNSPCDETTLSRGWRLPYSIGGMNIRYGIIRCYSVYALHLLFGYSCCLMFYVLQYFQSQEFPLFRNTYDKREQYIYVIMLLLLTIGVIISNSKGPLICFIFILLTKYDITQVFKIKVIAPLLLGVILLYIYFPEYIYNLFSLWDEDLAEEGAGSSISLREQQFEVAWRIFQMNPITGMGIRSASYLKTIDYTYAAIRGAESVWFKILPDQGIIGIIAYIYMYINIFKQGKTLVSIKILVPFLLAIMIYDTTNGHSIDRIIWWMCPLLAIYRYCELKEIEENT